MKIDYRFETKVPIRFRDLDALMHVNHAAYFTLLEQARMDYFSEILGWALPEDLKSWVLAEISCKYLMPLALGDNVTIAVKTNWMRNSSFGCAFEIRTQKDDKIAASGEFVQVHVSTKTGRASPIPDDLRSLISKFEGIATNVASASG